MRVGALGERAGGRLERAGAGLVGLIVGGTLVTVGGAMIACAVASALTDERDLWAFAVPGTLSSGLGVAMLLASAGAIRARLAIPPLVGFGAVTLAWVSAALVGSVPYLLAGTFDSPLDAMFEAMSGFTTTGATLIGDIEAQPNDILLWRSISQWLGGIGIVVLVVAVAPVTAPGLQRAFFAEVSGISADRLTPRIVDTAKIIAGIYLALTLACGVAYLAAGMGPFDAVNHMMTTVATAGFSTKNASIGAFDSIPIELVAVFFMIAGGVNFAFYWRLIKGGSIAPQWAEIRIYLSLIVVATVVVAASLLITGDSDRAGSALREAGFSVTTIVTTTGYATADFDAFNQFARIGLLLLMSVGACAGSTAGGMKIIRVLLLSKSAVQEVDRQLRPKAVQVLRVGKRPFPEAARRVVLGFLLVYVGVYATGFMAFAATGVDTMTALSATASMLGDIGPGMGEIGALQNFDAMPAFGRSVAIVLMLTGRLEVFTVVALAFGLVRLARHHTLR